MEVHHHSHTAPKKWKHYFWEFLMLFLAVFCGFLAEYQLEHTIEHQREKQFARQLLSDLQTDSVFFERRIKSINEIIAKHEKFYKLMTGPVRSTDRDILAACIPLIYTFDLQVTTATYDQMKTSGSLRYIRNPKLTEILQQYYEVLLPRALHGMEMGSQYYSNNIEPFILKHFRVQDFDFVTDTLKSGNPVILNRSGETDQLLLNIIESYAGSHKVILERLTKPAYKKLGEVIVFVKNEYHLK